MLSNVEPELADALRVLSDRDHAHFRATLVRIAATAGRVAAICEHVGAAKIAADCETLCELVTRAEAWSAHVALTGAAVEPLLGEVIGRLPELAAQLEEMNVHVMKILDEKRYGDIVGLAGVLETLAGVARHALEAIPKSS